ncbi:MAG: DUF58 domain-containing protein [Chloroflexia bacterium]|nr:DUF58 domain-containing protein [Chloroflexia bacterium]
MRKDWNIDKILRQGFWRRQREEQDKDSPQGLSGMEPTSAGRGVSEPAFCPEHPLPGRAVAARRRLLLVLCVYGLIFLGLAVRNGRILALVLPLLLYLGLAFFHAPPEIRLHVARSLSSDRVTQGTTVEVRLSITNLGAALEDVLLIDCAPPLPLKKGRMRLHCSLQAGETLEWSYIVDGGRGNYVFRGIHVLASDRLGLFQRWATFDAPERLFVMPEVFNLKRIAIRPQRTRVYSGLIPARLGGPGVEFFGVREYQQGDSVRWINWRATARQQEKWLINEFEQERAADVGLILDTRRRSYRQAGNEVLFEYAVQATAALADRFLSDGNRVGLLLYGDLLSWTFPGYGKIQRERILQSLAQARLGESLYFDEFRHLPTRLFPTHSQVVLITPLLQEDLPMLILLRARGYQLLVISPDPVSFEERYLKKSPEIELAKRFAYLQRVLLLHNLRQAGVRVLDWQTGTPLAQAVHASLGRQPVWFQALGLEV